MSMHLKPGNSEDVPEDPKRTSQEVKADEQVICPYTSKPPSRLARLRTTTAAVYISESLFYQGYVQATACHGAHHTSSGDADVLDVAESPTRILVWFLLKFFVVPQQKFLLLHGYKEWR